MISFDERVRFVHTGPLMPQAEEAIHTRRQNALNHAESRLLQEQAKALNAMSHAAYKADITHKKEQLKQMPIPALALAEAVRASAEGLQALERDTPQSIDAFATAAHNAFYSTRNEYFAVYDGANRMPALGTEDWVKTKYVTFNQAIQRIRVARLGIDSLRAASHEVLMKLKLYHEDYHNGLYAVYKKDVKRSFDNIFHNLTEAERLLKTLKDPPLDLADESQRQGRLYKMLDRAKRLAPNPYSF